MTIDASMLLPRPLRLDARDGIFRLSSRTRLVLGASPSDATQFAARGLQTALADLLGFELQLLPATKSDVENAVSLRLLETASGSFSEAQGEQGYVLRIDPSGASVSAMSDAGLFYGVQTLIQIAQLSGRHWPALSIEDKPALPVRGFMLDVSRGRVPTRVALIELIRTLAYYKFNHLQLYTEHTFRFASHPDFGADAGSLTPDDILALDTECRAHHIELVPNLQSVGHMAALLNLPQYEHLAETEWKWSLATARDETFTFLDELYSDLLPCFSSRLFNVGADEPWDMGMGQSKSLAANGGVGRVFLHHVLRLYDLVQKHDHQMLMWADVLKHHPELIGELPDDVLLLDWWYEASDRYETLDALKASGREFWVCPATSSWTTLFPRMENAVANIRDYVRQGIETGASGMLLTEWGDGGHYQIPSNSWYLYLWGAEVGWTGGTTDRDAFDLAFDRLFLADGSGAVTSALRRLGETMQNAPGWLTSWNSAMALYEEPLDGNLSEIVPSETVGATREAALAISPLLGRVRDQEIRHGLAFTVAQIDFATEKLETTRAIRALLSELSERTSPSVDGLQRFAVLLAEMRRQRDIIPALVEEFTNRWLSDSRPSEIKINLDRFAALQAQYDVALTWLDAQRAAYEHGEPVDGKLTSYDRKGYAVLHEASRRRLLQLRDIVGYDALPPDIKEWLGPEARKVEAG